MAAVDWFKAALENHKAIITLVLFVISLLGLNGYQYNESLAQEQRLERVVKSYNEGAEALVRFYTQPVKPAVHKAQVVTPIVQKADCGELCQRQCKALVEEHVNSWRHK